MNFSLDDLNPTTRFNYDESGEEWVELRLVPEAKYNEFRKQLGIKQKRIKEYDKQGKPTILYDIDNDETKVFALMDLANDYMISNWSLVTNKGETIPCTKENKKLLLSESPEFAVWIDNCHKKLKEDQEKRGENVIKN